MDDNTAAIAGIGILIVPVFLFFVFLIEREKTRRQSGGADADQVRALMVTAQRMERRIESLEMLLDTEVPGWRSRSMQS